MAGRSDRTTGDDPSTVGVEVFSHELSDATECKLYDLAGQVRTPIVDNPHLQYTSALPHERCT